MILNIHIVMTLFCLIVWEIETGRCMKVIDCGGVVRSVAWGPHQSMSLIAVAADTNVLLINPGLGDHLVTTKTDKMLEIIPQSDLMGKNSINN